VLIVLLPSDASNWAVADDEDVAEMAAVVELVGEVAMWSRTTGIIAF
jgi:hypothetical protein